MVRHWPLSPHSAGVLQRFDSSGDGDLSRVEFANALRSRLGLMNISDKDMEDLMDHFDTDGDGTISYDEFIDKVRKLDCPNSFISRSKRLVVHIHSVNRRKEL